VERRGGNVSVDDLACISWYWLQRLAGFGQGVIAAAALERRRLLWRRCRIPTEASAQNPE
jgi:hypothetical protein